MAKNQKPNLCVSRAPPSLFAHIALFFQTMHCEEIPPSHPPQPGRKGCFLLLVFYWAMKHFFIFTLKSYL